MRWTISLTAILFLSVAAFGQSTNGTITGVITDASGAVVAGAKISVQNPDTGSMYAATSTGTGNYTVAQLPSGTYVLKVEATGFRQFERTGLAVQPANVLRIDVPMQVGTTSDTVTVTAETPILKTENSATSYNVNFTQLENLPILAVNGGGTGAATNGLRDPYAAVKTVPGTRYVPSLGMSSNGNNGMNILIEGMTGNMQNPAGIVTMQTQPSAEAVQEVAVLTSNYSAEFGNISGAVLNVTMRSGTNRYHGTAYANGVNEVLNAAQPFSGLKNKQRRYDYGGSFGGPVKIPKLYDGADKTFFFFSYESYLEDGTINNTAATVPLPAYRTGDFSRLISLSGNQNVKISGANYIDPLGRSILSGQLFDPKSTRTVTCDKTAYPTATCTAGSLVQVRDPYLNNQISPDLFDNVSKKILALVPTPLGPNADAGQPSSNYQHSWSDQMHTYLPSIKVDHMFGARNHVSAYYQTVRYHSPLVYPNGAATGLPQPVEPGRGANSASHTARLAWDYNVTPTLLLHSSVGYSDQGIWLLPPITNYNAVTELGLRGATVNRLFPNITTAISTTTGGMTTIGPQGGFLTTQSSAQIPEAQFNATWVKGNHTIKGGFDWRLEFQPVSSLTNTAGNYTFGPNGTQQIALQSFAAPSISGTTGFQFASFVLGDVSNVRISAPANYRDQKSQTSAYVQDTWKVTRSLTLDYGLRYDYGTYLRERAGREGAFDVNTPDPAADGHPGGAIYEATCNCSFSKNYPWAFAPRIGLAYQLGSKNVFRAGFGIVYAPTNYAQGTVVSASDSGTPGYGDYVFQLQDGLPDALTPVWPNFNAAAGALSGTVGTGPAVLGPSAGRPSRQYQWSVGIQRALTSNLVVEASYVANRVIWLNANGLRTLNKLSVPQLNQLGFQVGNLTDAALLRSTWATANKSALASRSLSLPYSNFPTNQLVRQSILPFPQFNALNGATALGNSWYDALQLVVTQRFYRGLTVSANYTYSKNLALTSSDDPFNRSLGKDLAALDLPHQFRLSATYTVPEQRSGLFGKNKIVSYIVSGWQTGWFLQYQSAPMLAQPASSQTANPVSLWLGYGPGPAQQIPDQSLYATSWTDNQGVAHTTPIDLNCHCFDPRTTVVLNPGAWSAIPDGQFGANLSSIRSFRGFRQPTEDANFGRNFRITERSTLQIRVEWTNVFNRLLLPQPNSTANYKTNPTKVNGISTGGYGTVIPTAGNGIASMRSGQLVVRLTF
jgi:Carboxypeptidase regulatory-like domain/TonB dependent receptor-like, beta-barrel